MEEFLPGMKEFLIPVADTIENVWPVLNQEPKIIEEMMPVYKEVIKAIMNEEKISDKKFANWGKSFVDIRGPHLRNWIKALEESPIQNLIDKSQLLNFDKVEVFLKKKQLRMFKEVGSWIKNMMEVLQDLITIKTPENGAGWFEKFSDIVSEPFENDDESKIDMNDQDLFKVCIQQVFVNEHMI